MACVGTLAGFSLASFEGYFLPPVLATATRAAMKEALGTFRRYGVLGAAMFAGYAITEEVVVSVKGSRDWWAPFAAGSVVGLGASAVGTHCMTMSLCFVRHIFFVLKFCAQWLVVGS